ncbi:inovirus-type Gp2 protein [Pseudomonas aeruginosa]|uniref:inovirus-type Gp2 protein n=1 Tax=Pseudomonas aeruginosa TaxID=287 RepID=UPI00163BA7C4|nr:inovirus-type Gp2 protein [Pseudomonas aeruginosa]
MSNRTSFKHLNQSQISILVEQLVKAVEGLDNPVYLPQPQLNPYVNHLEQMVALFNGNDEYDYSAQLQVFQTAMQNVGIHWGLSGLESYDEDADRYRTTSEMLSALVQRIWRLTRKDEYRRVKHDQRRQALEQGDGLRRYVDGMFAGYARLLVVRVNFYYRTEAQTRLRVEHVFRDVGKLIRARRYSDIFVHEVGYVCSIEQGKCHGSRLGERQGRGFHAHAAFFFDGSKVRGDVYKAQQIGELWEQVTVGRGCYDSCNHDKEKKYRDRLGIGMIHRGALALRTNLYSVMDYLVKDDQHLRLRPQGRRTLRRGNPIR